MDRKIPVNCLFSFIIARKIVRFGKLNVIFPVDNYPFPNQILLHLDCIYTIRKRSATMLEFLRLYTLCVCTKLAQGQLFIGVLQQLNWNDAQATGTFLVCS